MEAIIRLAQNAIRELRKEVHWKEGKDIQHLSKRIRLGHLPEDSSVEQYSSLIHAISRNGESQVYYYSFRSDDYFIITYTIQNRFWRVIISSKGIMETAFPPDDPEKYIEENNFVLLGKMMDII